MVCVYHTPFTVFGKTGKTFLGVGVYSPFWRDPLLNGSLLLDELVEQAAAHEPTDDEPGDGERGSVLRCGDGQCSAAHGPLPEEVNQDSQRCTRGQDDDDELAHDVCSVALRRLRFVNGSRPFIPCQLTFPCLCVARTLLAVVRCGDASAACRS